MTFPRPAVITQRWVDEYDPITDTRETELTNSRVYYVDAELGMNDAGEHIITWDTGDQITGLSSAAPIIENEDGSWSTADGTITVRSVDTHDALVLAPSAGVPQPIAVIRAEILRGGVILAQELDAVVADDNTVVTLMLETGLGTYVRYGNDWQLLGPDSTSLEDLSLVAVGPGALDVYDGAEAARTTVSVFDLPVPSKRDAEISIEDPDDLPVDTESLDGEPVTAAGALIPMIASIMDMDMGLRFAAVHPGARWYVSKRAKALGVSERIPASWNVVLVR